MGIDSRFLNATHTDEKTSLRLQFDLLLTYTCAWDGLIVLTKKEIAQRLGTSVERVRLFLSQAKDKGEIIEKNSELYFTKYYEYDKSDPRLNRYVKHFGFLHGEWFKALPVMAKRIILEILSSRFYLHPSRTYKKKLNMMYHQFQYINGRKVMVQPGLFNIYSKKELNEHLEYVRQLFDVKIRATREGEEYLTVRFFKKGTDTETIINNQGKKLWVLQRLEEYGHFEDEVDPQALEQLVAIMDAYVKDIGFDAARMIFERALETALSSEKFISLLYQDSNKMTKYFNKVMSEIECTFGEHICRQAEVLEDERHEKIPEAQKLLRKIHEQILRLEERWIQRVINPKDRFNELPVMKPVFQHYMKKFARFIERYFHRDQKELEFVPYNWLEE